MADQPNSSWQRGLGLFAQLSGWLVGPLIASLFLGRWLDERYGTEPWLFLASTGLAFAITIYGMFSQAKKYIKAIEQEAKSKNIKDTKDQNGSNQ